MRLRQISPPSATPITVGEARDHLELFGSGHDSKLAGMIAGAVSHLDGVTGVLGRALVEQEWELSLDSFGGAAISLPLPPLKAVTSVTYIDPAGAEQTLSSSAYKVDAGENGRLLPAFGTTWPSTRAESGAVRVRFTAGYGTAPADVPAAIRSALLLMVGDLFENREAQTAGPLIGNPTVDNLLFPFRKVFP
ncbi:hypothetical protein ARC78_15220 [Stenotrophomonas pictorum JCM 9942]|uniref:PhiE125 gp8 family phage protein n=1 Tax=Stenotrophomonas pictorum JCM 9942 TaxID=1236960 RepID=A0A0R0A0P1_9GAMM|nr:phage gp6-like head-tail connector protein [Stenotrophomonas pictorum]KRG38827.1 hypothetical protein ARC78_15220 [Stenotrophomonas pictorum JCM 9942]